ncbi:MAG: transposase [Clostridiales bacterium]|nr:transposase [Clostridiales bacterium]
MAGKPNNKYSPEFKKKAVEKYLNGELGSMAYASRQLGLRSHEQLRQWIKLYKQDPELLKVDGRHFGKKDGVQKGIPKKDAFRNGSTFFSIDNVLESYKT